MGPTALLILTSSKPRYGEPWWKTLARHENELGAVVWLGNAGSSPNVQNDHFCHKNQSFHSWRYRFAAAQQWEPVTAALPHGSHGYLSTVANSTKKDFCLHSPLASVYYVCR